MRFVRVEYHAVREDIPETYCGLAALDDLPSLEEGQVDQLKGPFCVRCEIIIGHYWTEEGDQYKCHRCGTSSRVATTGQYDRCSVRANRTVLANQEDQAVLSEDKKEQWRQQVARLEKMIKGASSDKERERYESWKAELEARLAGKPIPSAPRSRGGSDDEATTRVVDWLKEHDGEPVTWKEFIAGVKLSSSRLGKVIGALIQSGRVSEDPQYCYHVIEGGEATSEPETGEPEQTAQAEEPAGSEAETSPNSGKEEPQEGAREAEVPKETIAKGDEVVDLEKATALFGDE